MSTLNPRLALVDVAIGTTQFELDVLHKFIGRRVDDWRGWRWLHIKQHATRSHHNWWFTNYIVGRTVHGFVILLRRRQ